MIQNTRACHALLFWRFTCPLRLLRWLADRAWTTIQRMLDKHRSGRSAGRSYIALHALNAGRDRLLDIRLEVLVADSNG